MSGKEVETGQGAAEEPAKVEEPAKAEELAKTEEPAKDEEPSKSEKPAKAEEPTKAEEPAKGAVKKPKAAKEAGGEQPAPTPTAKVKKSAAIEEIMAAIKKMTVLELAELVKALEAEFGVSAAAAPVTAAAAAPKRAKTGVQRRQKARRVEVVSSD